MKLLHGHADEVAAWVGWRIPLVRRRLERDPGCQPFGPAYAIGVLDASNTLVAGVVYHNWAPDCASVELSFAADTPKWATRNLLRELMEYPFGVLQANRTHIAVSRFNRPSRAFVEGFGFRREGVATDGFGPGDDAVCYRLLKREWLQAKWAKPRSTENPSTAPTLQA